MAEYHAPYGDERAYGIGNHFSDTANREEVLDLIYDYMDILDDVAMKEKENECANR